MRHRVYGKHLGRNRDERRALFKGLVHSLLSYGTIETSESKAKAIKGLIDKIINSVKKDTFSADNKLREKITGILPKLGNKTSGYTSTVRLGPRLGDQTVMVRLSLIGAEQLSVSGSRLSEKGKSVVSKSVTEKQKTDKPRSENRKQKTDNRKIK